MEVADWYFDVVSPFSYLQWKSRDRLGSELRLRPIPVVVGGIFSHWGQKGPAEIEAKRLHTYRACVWRASRLGLPFRFPPLHPFNPIPALRLIVALDDSEEAIDSLFDAAFRDGRDLSQWDVLEQLAGDLGVTDLRALIDDPAVKRRLRDNTERAQEAGVFGVPTIALRGELFWGEDMTDMLLDFLGNPELFSSPEMRALEGVAVGVRRT